MTNWGYAKLIILGVLGALLLLLVQWLAFRLLPQPPADVIARMQHVRRATLPGDYQGDADIFELDRALMEAELEQPVAHHNPTPPLGAKIPPQRTPEATSSFPPSLRVLCVF